LLGRCRVGDEKHACNAAAKRTDGPPAARHGIEVAVSVGRWRRELQSEVLRVPGTLVGSASIGSILRVLTGASLPGAARAAKLAPTGGWGIWRR
jgi:hypothetical protein